MTLPATRTTVLALCVASAPAWAQVPGQAWNGHHPGDRWGHTVAVVGDVNADGVDDWAVGAPDADRTITQPFPLTFEDAGRVFVYSGVTGAVLHTWSGDLNGGTEFGFAIAGAGDVDHDGHDDVLVSAPRADSSIQQSGIVRLFSGATGGLLREFAGTQVQARFGHSLDGGHDVNGDGALDVLIGSPQENLDGFFGGPDQEGRVRLFSATSGALLWTAGSASMDTGNPACVHPVCSQSVRPAGFGTAVAMLGDVNGDGDDEVVIGSPGSDFSHASFNPFTGEGTTTLTVGAGSVHLIEPFGDTAPIRHGLSENLHMGATLAALGGPLAQNKDGLAVGVPWEGAAGFVEILTLDDSLTLLRTHDGAPGLHLGDSVSGIGDVDGDGRVDVLLGSATASPGSPFQILQAGQAFVYSGADGSLLETISGTVGFGHLGAALAGGDVDGDGLPDVLTGAPDADSSFPDAGTAFLFPGHGCVAQAVLYGSGWPGTLGEPELTANGDPEIDSPGFTVRLTNSRGAPTTTALFLGFFGASLPLKDATLLVEPVITIVFSLPVGTSNLALPIPDDVGLCGLHLRLQALETDPGATAGTSFTRGLRLELGY